jgi:hypothetical protein
MSERPDPFFKPIQETGPASGWAKVRTHLLQKLVDDELLQRDGWFILNVRRPLIFILFLESLRTHQRQSRTERLATIFRRIGNYFLGLFPSRCRKQETNRTETV